MNWKEIKMKSSKTWYECGNSLISFKTSWKVYVQNHCLTQLRRVRRIRFKITLTSINFLFQETNRTQWMDSFTSKKSTTSGKFYWIQLEYELVIIGCIGYLPMLLKFWIKTISIFNFWMNCWLVCRHQEILKSNSCRVVSFSFYINSPCVGIKETN